MYRWAMTLALGFLLAQSVLAGLPDRTLARQQTNPRVFGSTQSGETLFLTTSLGLYAVDAAMGTELWRVATPSRANSQPVVAGGMVYFTSDWNPPANPSAVVYGVDASTGQELWTFEPGGPLGVGSRGQTRSLIVSGGMVYVFDDLRVYVLDAQTGPVNGKPVDSAFLPIGSKIVAAQGGRVLLSNLSDSEVGCVDLASGAQLWTAKISTDSFGSPAASNDTTLFLVDADNAIVASSWETGAEEWRMPPAGESSIKFVRAEQDTVLYGLDEEVAALDAANGTMKWQVSVTTGYLDAAVSNDETVFIATDDGALAAYDFETAASRWSRALPTRAIGLSIDTSGNLLVVLAGAGPGASDPSTSDALLIAPTDGSLLWDLSLQP